VDNARRLSRPPAALKELRDAVNLFQVDGAYRIPVPIGARRANTTGLRAGADPRVPNGLEPSPVGSVPSAVFARNTAMRLAITVGRPGIVRGLGERGPERRK
jgi:hypothetical protein